MKWIGNSLRLCEFLLKQEEKTKIQFDFNEFGCKTSNEMSLISDALKAMALNGYLRYSDGIIFFEKDAILNYINFYNLRKNVENEYLFACQCLRDAYAISWFKKIEFSTSMARPIIVSSIYNFSSAVSIGINKFLRDTNGKYNIYSISSGVGKFLKDDEKSKLLLKEKNKEFRIELKRLDQTIQEFNNFRDELFAHSDKDTMLKVEQVDEVKAIEILTNILDYCVFMINLIDDDKVQDSGKTKAELSIEAGYFCSQLIKK